MLAVVRKRKDEHTAVSADLVRPVALHLRHISFPAAVRTLVRSWVEPRRQGAHFTYEVIVVNDGSSDGTSAVAFDFIRRFGFDAVRLLQLPQNCGKVDCCQYSSSDLHQLVASCLHLQNKPCFSSAVLICYVYSRRMLGYAEQRQLVSLSRRWFATCRGTR